MSAQIIQKNGKAEFAVIPIEEYNRLLSMAEDFDDLVAYDKAIAELQSGEDEAIPAEIVARLVAGDEHPLKVWREFRGMTQTGLADQAGVSQGQVALIEGGKRQGTVDVLKGLARVLNVDLDDLV
ncbi:MAG: helix-turn-helix transcriptional regulator [Gammaproteobacteria bacterium]|nr:helix-turn-helix transcriptional regulator [Gammaproteobacteria bacterium]